MTDNGIPTHCICWLLNCVNVQAYLFWRTPMNWLCDTRNLRVMCKLCYLICILSFCNKLRRKISNNFWFIAWQWKWHSQQLQLLCYVFFGYIYQLKCILFQNICHMSLVKVWCDRFVHHADHCERQSVTFYLAFEFWLSEKASKFWYEKQSSMFKFVFLY